MINTFNDSICSEIRSYYGISKDKTKTAEFFANKYDLPFDEIINYIDTINNNSNIDDNRNTVNKPQYHFGYTTEQIVKRYPLPFRIICVLLIIASCCLLVYFTTNNYSNKTKIYSIISIGVCVVLWLISIRRRTVGKYLYTFSHLNYFIHFSLLQILFLILLAGIAFLLAYTDLNTTYRNAIVIVIFVIVIIMAFRFFMKSQEQSTSTVSIMNGKLRYQIYKIDNLHTSPSKENYVDRNYRIQSWGVSHNYNIENITSYDITYKYIVIYGNIDYYTNDCAQNKITKEETITKLAVPKCFKHYNELLKLIEQIKNGKEIKE